MSGMTITEFLAQRLDEEEAAAQVLLDRMPRWVMAHDLPNAAAGVAEHIMRHDPARVLAQVAAMRAIVEDCRPYVTPGTSLHASDDGVADRVLRHLAAIWQSHPDYDPAWAPKGE